MLELFRLLDRITDTTLPVVIQGESGTGKELVARAHPLRTARAASGRSSARTAPRSPRRCSSRRCSATCAAPSPAPTTTPAACSRSPTAARCSSTRSARCRRACRASCCACCRRASSAASARADAQGRRPHRRRDEPRPRAHGRGGEVPPRPVFPAQRGADCAAAAARSARRHPAHGRALPGQAGRAGRPPERRSRLDPAALARLAAYRWPGNVRELENEITRADALSGARITVADLAPRIGAADEAGVVSTEDHDNLVLKPRVERLERSLVREALGRSREQPDQGRRAAGPVPVWLAEEAQALQLRALAATNHVAIPPPTSLTPGRPIWPRFPRRIVGVPLATQPLARESAQ